MNYLRILNTKEIRKIHHCTVVLSRGEGASGATIVDTRHHLLHLKEKTGSKKFLKTGPLMYLPIPLSYNLDIDSAASLQHYWIMSQILKRNELNSIFKLNSQG